MPPVINLKVTNDFEQASKDLKRFGTVTESERKKIEKFVKEFKTERIEAFTDRNKRAAAAIRATRGSTEAAKKELLGLQRQMESLIRKGLDPQDDALKPLIKRYDELNREMIENTRISKMNEDAVKGAQMALVGLGAVVGIAVGKTTLMASEVEELNNKFNVVFEGMQEDTQEWIDNYSAAVARGSDDTKEFLTNLQDIQTGFGATIADGAKFGKVVIGVANDLSSFSNVPIDETFAAIQSGLSGQFRALQRLGVGINVAIIDQSDYAKSIEKTWKEMTNLEKREAILQEIVRQSPNATGQAIKSWQDYDFTLGDAAKTSETFANQQKLLPGLIKDIGGEIGSIFLPAATELLKNLNDILKNFRTFIRDGENLEELITIIGVSLAGLTSGLIAFLAVSKGGAVLKGIITAFKTFNLVIATNPIGALAVILTTILIPAIILLQLVLLHSGC